MDKKYLRKILLVVAVMLVVAILVTSTVNFYFTSPESEIVTQFPCEETISLSVECPAYVTRNEHVIDYDITSKSVLYFFDSGEKVPKNSILAYVYDNKDYHDIIERIYDNRKQIEHFQDIISAYDMFTLTELNDEIFKLTNRINYCMSANDTTELEKLENKLLLYIGVRDIKVSSDATIEDCHRKISELNDEINNLVSSMGDDYDVVKSTMSGYFFRGTDGFENKVTPDVIESISCAEVVDLFDLKVNDTNSLGKIVEGYDWYSVCVIPASMISDFTVGNEYDIEITNENNLNMSMTLSRILYTYGEDKAALVFYSEQSATAFDYSRFQYFNVIYKTYTGYAIPTTAIRYVNGVQGVYILYGYRVDFRQIVPLYERDGVIIADINAKSTSDYRILSYYDNIIMKGFDLYVDKIID